MKVTIRQGLCNLSFDQAKSLKHQYWLCDYTYKAVIHSDYQLARIDCCYPIYIYLVSDDPIEAFDTVLLPNGTTKRITHEDMVDYIDSCSNGTKKVIGLAPLEIVQKIAKNRLKIGDEIERSQYLRIIQ